MNGQVIEINKRPKRKPDYKNMKPPVSLESLEAKQKKMYVANSRQFLGLGEPEVVICSINGKYLTEVTQKQIDDNGVDRFMVDIGSKKYSVWDFAMGVNAI